MKTKHDVLHINYSELHFNSDPQDDAAFVHLTLDCGVHNLPPKVHVLFDDEYGNDGITELNFVEVQVWGGVATAAIYDGDFRLTVYMLSTDVPPDDELEDTDFYLKTEFDKSEAIRKNDLSHLKPGDKAYHTVYGECEIYRPEGGNADPNKIYYRMIDPDSNSVYPSYSTGYPVWKSGRNGGKNSNPALFESLGSAIAYLASCR